MRIIWKGKNTELTPALKAYIESKLVGPTGKLLAAQEANDPMLEIEIARTTRHHRKGQVWWAEANLTIGKQLIRAEHSGEDPREVVDLIEDELTREIKSFKGKLKTKQIRGARKIKRLLRRGS